MSLKSIISRKNISVFLFLLILYGFMVYLAISYTTAKHGYYNYQSTLWADKSGYYVYLPATFIYGYHADAFPADAADKAGSGFVLDKEQNKMIDKYTSGIAILILPFFLIAHFLASLQGCADGFGPVYQQMLNFTGPFYALLGLLLLYRFLRNYVEHFAAFASCILIFAGTNLYYYAIADGFMSHVYSFFLFALTLYSTKNYKLSGHKTKWAAVIFASAFFILLIRPTDIIILLLLPFLDFENLKKVWQFIRSFITIKKILSAVVLFLLIFVPQMIYWKFAYGSYITYSYGSEGFDYLACPKIVEILFSTNNGLILYNPLYLVLIVSMLILAVRKYKTGLPFLIITGIALYLTASWGCWYYGCSFGMRPMVQYTAVMAFPFAIMLDRLRFKKILLTVLIFFFLVLTYFSLNLVYVFERCSYCETWDFMEYNKFLVKAGWGSITGKDFYWTDDFENDIVAHTGAGRHRIESEEALSGNFVTETSKDCQFSSGFSETFVKIRSEMPKEVIITVFVKNEKTDTSTFIVCDITRNDSVIFWQAKNVEPTPNEGWHLEEHKVSLPPLDLNDYIKVYLWNSAGRVSLADDFKVKLIY